MTQGGSQKDTSSKLKGVWSIVIMTKAMIFSRSTRQMICLSTENLKGCNVHVLPQVVGIQLVGQMPAPQIAMLCCWSALLSAY